MSDAIVIAAGGTGGHMFPALAVADVLRGRGARVTLLTDARGARYARDGDVRVVRAGSPTGGVLDAARGTAMLGIGALQCRRHLRRLRPGAAALFGGYASVPAGLAAVLRHVPFLVHEQNAVLGKANRLTARFARVLALSFERTRALPPSTHAETMLTGNPVRPGFDLGATEAAEPDGRFRLLVLGGSQGARVFSDVVPAAIAAVPQGLRDRLEVVQQCRPEDLDRTRAAYAAIPFEAELAAFFDDIPRRMVRADLVLSRAGASTVGEIMALGRAAVLVPYPHAADDHQTANAQALAEAGAAVLLPQPEATVAGLAAMLSDLAAAPERLAAMRAAARDLARPEAPECLADAILNLCSSGEPR